MLTIRAPNAAAEQEELTAFFASFEWLYLTHRYSPPAQGLLLRLLTLSGLSPVWWQPFGMQLIQPGQASVVLINMNLAHRAQEPLELLPAVTEIWTYAAQVDAILREPPRMPVYLTAYNYTQVDYLTDLIQVYGQAIAPLYQAPWPTTAQLPQKAVPPIGFLQQAVAMMGTTAGAIEQLIERGCQHGH